MVMLDRYVLRFRAPLHQADRGIGIETTALTVRSDTLFSAICVGMRETRGVGMVDELLEWFAQGDPPFVLSSTFPWAASIFLFPRPRIVPPGGLARRARWVSAAVLQSLLDGDAVGDADEPLDLGSENPAWVLAAERVLLGAEAHWALTKVPRVTVDRRTQASAVYRAGRTVFGPEAGLYFLVLWRDRIWEPLFDDALAYLSDAGLGGERSAGHGQFSIAGHDVMTIDDCPESSHRLTLGLYHPTADEVAAGALDSPAAYDLEVRRGWTTETTNGGVWRKSVRMLTEGALIQKVSETAGDLVDVTPDGSPGHRVFRSGLTFTLGVPLEMTGGRV